MIRWTQVCRAESSAAAYRRALDWFARKPLADAIALIEAEIVKKDAICAEWQQQQETKRTEAANAEYRAQAEVVEETE